MKGAVVSGLNHPIGSNPLEWPGADTTATLVSIGADDDDPLVGEVGDFVIKEAGSGKFRLYVDESGAPALLLSGTQAIDVVLTYDDGTTDNLIGDITKQEALDFANGPFDFTISQAITAGTPIGAFDVSGGITDEYLDGIVTGDDSGPFEVRDSDMTLVYKGGSLEVKTYNLDLTVSGDAGLANRMIIDDVTVTVTASNQAATALGAFTEPVKENVEGVDAPDDPDTTATDPKPGLVSADTSVGDASDGVTNPDNDTLTYSIITTPSVFKIDPSTGAVTVGDDGISDTTGDGPTEADPDGTYGRPQGDGGKLKDETDKYSDIVYEFDIKVSDGVSANDQIIKATVTVDVNEPPVVNSATEKTDDDGNKYFEAGYTDTDPFGTAIFDVGTVLSDDQIASDLDYDLMVTGPENVAPATFTISSSGVVQLNFPGIVRRADFWMVAITVEDGFVNTPLTEDEEDAADARDPDAVITVKISVTEGIRPDRVHHEVAIAENTAGGTEIVDLTTIT